MALLKYSDTDGIRREREKLGAGGWAAPLLILAVAGVPLMVGAHFRFFPDPSKPGVVAVYASLDEVPVLFDPVTQEALVRYCGDPEGEIQFVGKDTEFSPTTGERCWPLTPAVLKKLREQERREREAAATEAAQEEASAERRERERALEAAQASARQAEAQFRERYVNASVLRGLQPGSMVVAVSDSGLARRIAQDLRDRGVAVATDLLTDQVFDGTILSRLSTGDRPLLQRLRIMGTGATLLIGELDREPAVQTGIGNSLNIRGHLSVHLLPSSGEHPLALPTIHEVGAGFTEKQAQDALERRLAAALLEHSEMARLLP